MSTIVPVAARLCGVCRKPKTETLSGYFLPGRHFTDPPDDGVLLVICIECIDALGVKARAKFGPRKVPELPAHDPFKLPAHEAAALPAHDMMAYEEAWSTPSDES